MRRERVALDALPLVPAPHLGWPAWLTATLRGVRYRRVRAAAAVSAATAPAAKPRPFRLRAPIVPENDLHASVAEALDRLLLPPAVWTTFPAGSVPLPPQFAAKLSRLGLKRGWPDVLICHHGIFGIELKRVGGRLSTTRIVRTRRGAPRILDGQADVFPRLIEAGMRIAVCHSIAEVMAALTLWNVPTRCVS